MGRGEKIRNGEVWKGTHGERREKSSGDRKRKKRKKLKKIKGIQIFWA